MKPPAEQTCFTLRREPGLVIVRLFGEIDDRQSREWRSDLSAEIALRGAPRFVAFDMFDAQPKNSMSTRFDVAAYARELMKQVHWVALLMPSSAGGMLVVRVIAGIVATSRVSLLTSKQSFHQALEAMRKGNRPND